MRIVFFRNKRLLQTAGGIERVFVHLSNVLSDNGYTVFLVTNEDKPNKLFYSLSEKVTFHNIGGTRFKGLRYLLAKLFSFFPSLYKAFPFLYYWDQKGYTAQKLQEYFTSVSPDVLLLSEPDDLIHLCHNTEYAAKIVLMFHGSPTHILSQKSAQLETLQPLFTRLAACLVLTEDQKRQLSSFYSGRIEVIGNIVPLFENNTPVFQHHGMVYMGRIEAGKNQKALIEAFSKISDNHKSWRIRLYGSGKPNAIQELLSEIKKYRLENQIAYMGLTSNLNEALANASLAPFPSLREGFGMALAEAMSQGLVPIGFKDACGVNEIIVDGVNGFLASDLDDFSQKLALLMDNDALRSAMSEKARASMERYSETNIVALWVAFLNSL